MPKNLTVEIKLDDLENISVGEIGKQLGVAVAAICGKLLTCDREDAADISAFLVNNFIPDNIHTDVIAMSVMYVFEEER